MAYNATGTVFNIERFHVHDGDGIRTVIFLKGCLLQCPWCCNPESQNMHPQMSVKKNLCIGCGCCCQSCKNGAITMINGVPVTAQNKCDLCGECIKHCPNQAREIYGKKMSTDQLLKEVKRDAEFYRRSGGGVTFSGGEPALQADFVWECSDVLSREGIDINVETCGAAPYELLERAVDRASLVLFDIKTLDKESADEIFGQISPTLPTENLRKLRAIGKDVRIRCPIVPGYNYSLSFVKGVIELAKENGIERVDLLPFHQLGRYKYEALDMPYKLANLNQLGYQDVEDLRALIIRNGLNSQTGG